MTRMLALLTAALFTLTLLVSPASAATTPLVSGHRFEYGVTGYRPNSLEALNHVLANGVRAVETDVRWTKDQRMVIFHDSRMEWTTRCYGRVEDLAYAQLRACADDRQVPNFYDVLRIVHAKPGVLLNPEVKIVAGQPLTPTQAHEYAERVREFGMSSRTIMSSFSEAAIAQVKRQPDAPGLRYAWINEAPGVSVSRVRAAGTVYMPSYVKTGLTAAGVQQLHAAGVSVWAWPALPTDWPKLRALGVDAMVPNDPIAARAWVAKQ